MYDIRGFIEEVEKILDSHYLGKPGQYRRWNVQNEEGSRELSCSPYGSACASNILYTIGRMPELAQEREEFVVVLKNFQNPENGLFESEGSLNTHTTAFLAGALNLFDEKPDFQPIGFEKYLGKDGFYEFMEEINWAKDPWLGAHLGAGIYGAMVLTKYGDDAWEDMYFKWLDDNADPETGLWRKNALEGAPKFHYLASTFHYVFNYEFAKRALPYPTELLNTIISAYYEGVCIDFSKSFGWADIDYSYLVCRVQRRAGCRFEETQKILKEIADGLINQLLGMNVAENDSLNDLNTLFAIVSALALLQDALPGYIKTSRPLKLVIDRRPFL